MKTKSTLNFAVAALLTDLSGKVPSEIQLTLAGTFKAKDGRPTGLDGWIMNADNAKSIIELANAQKDPLPIDYEHQTLRSQQNGQPAPAAGFFKNLVWRDGIGLFATDVEWTKSAALAIQDKEYRYISPVMQYDPKTGVVTKILMAALTNNPALDGMKDLAALAADYLSQQQDSQMSDAEKIKKLEAENADLKKQLEDSKVACATAEDKAKKAACAAEAGTVDLSAHVPVAAFTDMQEKFVALSAKFNQNAVDDLVKVGLSDGRITPALADWAKGLEYSALSAFLDKATPILGLSGKQTGDKPPEDETKPELTSEEIAVCSAMGLTHDQFIATKEGKK